MEIFIKLKTSVLKIKYSVWVFIALCHSHCVNSSMIGYTFKAIFKMFHRCVLLTNVSHCYYNLCVYVITSLWLGWLSLSQWKRVQPRYFYYRMKIENENYRIVQWKLSIILLVGITWIQNKYHSELRCWAGRFSDSTDSKNDLIWGVD